MLRKCTNYCTGCKSQIRDIFIKILFGVVALYKAVDEKQSKLRISDKHAPVEQRGADMTARHVRSTSKFF